MTKAVSQWESALNGSRVAACSTCLAFSSAAIVRIGQPKHEEKGEGIIYDNLLAGSREFLAVFRESVREPCAVQELVTAVRVWKLCIERESSFTNKSILLEILLNTS